MLTEADLETNVLEFRQRSFQFDRLVDRATGAIALFGRTETENERQLRPQLIRLTLVVPIAWVVRDEAADVLRVARSGTPSLPPPISAVVEIRAEPPQFEEQGLRWRRTRLGAAGYVYVPEELADELLSADGQRALGIS